MAEYPNEEPLAWLIIRFSSGDKFSMELVYSPLTDDHYMDDGDVAWPLYTIDNDNRVIGQSLIKDLENKA